jgi:hypothetical protein
MCVYARIPEYMKDGHMGSVAKNKFWASESVIEMTGYVEIPNSLSIKIPCLFYSLFYYPYHLSLSDHVHCFKSIYPFCGPSKRIEIQSRLSYKGKKATDVRQGDSMEI